MTDFNKAPYQPPSPQPEGEVPRAFWTRAEWVKELQRLEGVKDVMDRTFTDEEQRLGMSAYNILIGKLSVAREFVISYAEQEIQIDTE